MRKERQRTIAFLAGSVALLIAAEGVLRVIGLLYAPLLETGQDQTGPVMGHTILCVGDSFTFGLGAERAMSYPAQLERLLNADRPSKTVAVLNHGVPARNTAQLLHFLERDIGSAKPSVLLVLAGGANLWNYWGYRAYSEQNSLLTYFNDLLYRIRLFKLAKLISHNLSAKALPGEAEIQPPNGRAVPDRASFFNDPDRSEILALPDNSSAACFDKGAVFAEMGDYAAAEKYFRKGIGLDPADSSNYAGMGWMYCGQKEFKKALQWFQKAVEIDPANTSCYGGIAQSFSEMHMYREALVFFRRQSTQNPAAYDYISLFEKSLEKDTRQEVKPWVRMDLESIISLARQYDITVVLQSYPEHVNNPGYDMVNDVIRAIAERLDVLFVDHSSLFKKLAENQTSSEEYFVPDGHPNSRGYGFMAASILDILTRHNTLEPIKRRETER